MIQALLKNRQRPDLPPVPVCFPIAEYESLYSNLEAIEIGHIAIRDCFVVKLGGDYPILKRLQETEINVDELDYLAKRLESFDQYELAQFQGAAVSQDYSDMTDFINLTFCCQEVTVVQDFTDLTAVGRTHYMNLHGGLTEDELKTVDFRKTALSLLLNEEGKITPYGVVYDNGMKLEPYYDGLYFPDYRYSGDTLLTMAATDRSLPEDTKDIAWLYLPVEECQINRALQRAGIQTEDMRLRIEDNELPDALAERLEIEEDLFEINKLCACVQRLDHEAYPKLEAALQMVQPSGITEARHLIEQLDLFDFISGISTPEEYGQYMITESGHFEYDDNLNEFYDYKKYGQWRMDHEQGQFVNGGYISYHGFISIDEVLAGSRSERLDMMMGGM
jgi:predicted metal-binding transcription factor (methanogenesis marker protein 9)